MSTYNGRHGPNVSQYLRDLNIISPQDTTADDNFSIEDDLALFTNTQFFDFDSGQNLDYQAQPVKPEAKPVGHNSTSPSDVSTAPPSVIGDMANLDFMSSDFHFPEFNTAYAAPPVNAFPEGVSNFQSLPSDPASAQPAQSQLQFRQSTAQPGDKRKVDAMNSPAMTFEETSRVAAEEDKRRRNTAASARFRIKKKQREQALEKSAKEMTEKITAFEGRISQLETENKWLKNLLVEKNEGSEDITAIWKDFIKHANEKKAKSGEKPVSETIKEER